MTTDGTDIGNRRYRTKRDFLNVQRRVWQTIYNSGKFSYGLLSNISKTFNNFSWIDPANTEFLEIADQIQACSITLTSKTTEP